jgi:hypothetical protein
MLAASVRMQAYWPYEVVSFWIYTARLVVILIPGPRESSSVSDLTVHDRRVTPIAKPALFRKASTAPAGTPLRHAYGRQARRSVGQHTVQVCFPSSRLRAPVSRGVSAVSSRTLVNNAG